LNEVGRPLRRPVDPGAVRAIEYEIVPLTLAPLPVANHLLGDPTAFRHVAVLRCVDSRGEKVTVLGRADQFQQLLESGAASNPSGVTLPRDAFPVVIDGWQLANRI